MMTRPAADEFDNLSPSVQAEINTSIESGRTTNSVETADLAIRLCRDRRRLRRKQLSVILPTILLGAGLLTFVMIAQTEEGGVQTEDVVFVSVFMAIAGGGFALWWWSALLRPLQRAEVANRIVIEGGVPPEPRAPRFANWMYAIFISWILTAILGAILLRGLDLPIPEWVGFLVWALIAYGTKLALDERDRAGEA